MAVHQLLSYARLGDAVTHQALALRPHLARGGDTSAILAHGWDDSVADDVVPITAAADGQVHRDDLVLYHVTIGCEPALRWLRARGGPYGIVHHNITPPHFFEGLSWEHARLTEQGRRELEVLAGEAVVVIADSAFNAREIEALGSAVDAVHPPVASTRRLADLPDVPRLSRRLRRRHRPWFVHVGQLAPHKRSHLLVAALHLLTEHLRTDAALSLVGAAPVPAYGRMVEELVADLVPGRVELTGPVPDAELAARVRHARALVTASAHEGFCVPVVEAMAMGVPVLACDAGAVAETAGGAALLLPSDPPLTLLAEAMHALATDDALVAELGRRGRRRAAELDSSIDFGRLAEVILARAARVADRR